MPANSPTRQKLLKRRKASPLVESKMGAVVWEQIETMTTQGRNFGERRKG
jgi:hypothetical protein